MQIVDVDIGQHCTVYDLIDPHWNRIRLSLNLGDTSTYLVETHLAGEWPSANGRHFNFRRLMVSIIIADAGAAHGSHLPNSVNHLH